MNTLHRQSGLTLIELMVAITAGVIVVFAGTSFLISSLSANATNMHYTRVNQDLREVVTAITKDLARAGEWSLADDIVNASASGDLVLSGNAGSVTATAYVPGSVATADIFTFPNAAAALPQRTLVLLIDNAGVSTRYDLTINSVQNSNTISVSIPSGVTLPTNTARAGGWTVLNPFAGVVATADCVLSSYDLDGDGVQNSNEHFGFRRNAADGTIESSTTATSCAAGTWTAFTDPEFVDINAFNVTQLRNNLVAANHLNVVLDQYLVSVTGTLVSDASAQRSVEQAVKVRNNAYN